MEAFKKDPFEGKINLSVGEYMNQKSTILMKTVEKAETLILRDSNRHHGYLHALGMPDINEAAINLLLGANHPALKGCTGYTLLLQVNKF